jgi:6-hydroxy-3-succinoylpyridine 3-monooxygenase
LAVVVRGSRSAAFKWFDAPSPRFGDQAPITLMATEEGLVRVIQYMEDWILKNAA